MNPIDMDALRVVEREKGITFESVVAALEQALAAAYKRSPEAVAEEARVEIDRKTGSVTVFAQEVEEIEETGEFRVLREWEATPPDFGRIAAQTAKQVILQRIRDAERELTYGEYSGRESDIVTAIVQQADPRYVLLDLGRGVEALLPQAEQVPGERYDHGSRIKAYIVEVRRSPRGPQIICSRTHPNLIKRLFELEVPEIVDGIVEIKQVAREPGHRSKIAVSSKDPKVDPTGACVGPRGSRVRMVVNELRGEKVDIILWSDVAEEFVSNALSPAKVKEVRTDPQTQTAVVIVPDFQLSLAIGKEGQNARLAARLTGWRIDIKSESQAAQDEAKQAAKAQARAAAIAAEPGQEAGEAEEPVQAKESSLGAGSDSAVSTLPSDIASVPDTATSNGEVHSELGAGAEDEGPLSDSPKAISPSSETNGDGAVSDGVSPSSSSEDAAEAEVAVGYLGKDDKD